MKIPRDIHFYLFIYIFKPPHRAWCAFAE
jgi:hypothetical protein